MRQPAPKNFYCQKHPKTQLHSLHYYTWKANSLQKYREKWRNVDIKNNALEFLYCPKCDDVYKVTVKLAKIRKQLKNFHQILGQERLDKQEEVRNIVRIGKKKFKAEQKAKYGRRSGRPYSPKPLPIRVKSLRDGWYFSKDKIRFHYIKQNRFYCRPSYPIILDIIPVTNIRKLQRKMCKFCKVKKGIRTFNQTETWNKHYQKKLKDDREKYVQRKKTQTWKEKQEKLIRNRVNYAKKYGKRKQGRSPA